VLWSNDDVSQMGILQHSVIRASRDHSVAYTSPISIVSAVLFACLWNKPSISIFQSQNANGMKELVLFLRPEPLLLHMPRADRMLDGWFWPHKGKVVERKIVEFIFLPTESTSTCRYNSIQTSTEGQQAIWTANSSQSTSHKRGSPDIPILSGNHKRIKIAGSDQILLIRSDGRLACPFCKYDPSRYISVYGACTFPPGFSNIKSLM
jgi:hypothetical protein